MRRLVRPRLAASLLLTLTFTARPAGAVAQTAVAGPGKSAAVAAPGLPEYEGLYDYRDGATLWMVTGGGALYAIIGDGKYLLRPASVDTFTNVVGEKIPFLRDGSGRVVAFMEHGDRFARRSTSVPPELRASLVPRPPGRDGRPRPYAYQAPAVLPDGVPVAPAGAGTITPGLATKIVDGVLNGSYPDVRSILLYHKGALRLEEYFYGYDAERPQPMRSLTKSVIALLAGAAVDRGLVQADAPVLGRLGYPAFANPDPRKGRVTLAELLSNESGFACDDHDAASPGNETRIYETPDWVRTFVDLPMAADPGTSGHYCSAGEITAGRIVELAAGKPLPDFAQEVLFGPLGIRRSDWRWTFRLDRSQRNEFGQIYLRARDMLKLGLLIQERGEWRGRRVVSARWIDRATGVESHVDDSDYGLGIWHRWYGVRTTAGTRRVDTIMLSGNGGQKVYLVPSLDLIAVFTGGAFNQESPSNDIMARVLLPALVAAARP